MNISSLWRAGKAMPRRRGFISSVHFERLQYSKLLLQQLTPIWMQQQQHPLLTVRGHRALDTLSLQRLHCVSHHLSGDIYALRVAAGKRATTDEGLFLRITKRKNTTLEARDKQGWEKGIPCEALLNSGAMPATELI